jgi:hypothetical protein
MRLALIAALSVSVCGLAACVQSTKAPFDAGVCYAVEPGEEGQPPRFNVVAKDQPQIEFCAARLEEMRLRFLRMGGNRREIVGAFQGRFIFIDRAGVSFGQTLEGSRFMALARTGDGRLAIPGAIQREVDAAERPTPPPAS